MSENKGKVEVQCSGFQELLDMGVCPYCNVDLVDGWCPECGTGTSKA